MPAKDIFGREMAFPGPGEGLSGAGEDVASGQTTSFPGPRRRCQDLTELPPREVLRERFHRALAAARARLEQRALRGKSSTEEVDDGGQ